MQTVTILETRFWCGLTLRESSRRDVGAIVKITKFIHHQGRSVGAPVQSAIFSRPLVGLLSASAGSGWSNRFRWAEGSRLKEGKGRQKKEKERKGKKKREKERTRRNKREQERTRENKREQERTRENESNSIS